MPWFTCKVDSAGPQEDGQVNIKLDAEGNEWSGTRWFIADTTVRKEMLATALTALPLQLSVHALLASTAEYSQIQRLYIRRSA